jgi:hypothetical protein
VANYFSADVSQYDVGARGLLTPLVPPRVGAGVGPQELAVSPDGRDVYVANRDGDSVSQYDVRAGGALMPMSPATVAAGDLPTGVAVTPLPRVPTSADQCRHGGWRDFGFESRLHCFTFVVLTRVCAALERKGITPSFCPPRPPRPW